MLLRSTSSFVPSIAHAAGKKNTYMVVSSIDPDLLDVFVDGTKVFRFSLANLLASQSLVFDTVAKGVVLKQGANGLCGTFIANGTTPVTVSSTAIAITDAVIISLNTVGGTVGVQPHVATITASTSFTVVATAGDTSTYNWAIIKNAA